MCVATVSTPVASAYATHRSYIWNDKQNTILFDIFFKCISLWKINKKREPATTDSL